MNAVTGAYSFTGRYIAARLLEDGQDVLTLTRRKPSESPFDERVPALPLDFSDGAGLRRALAGVDTLYNTYWIRSPRSGTTFATAVRNTGVLLDAARHAGVRRVVQLSVTNAAPDSPYAYFRGKAAVEEAVRASGLSFAVVRPTLVFGRGEILVNNIAWLLRRLPLFLVARDRAYRLQPVAAQDVADICVRLGASDQDAVADAAGPRVLAFEELVREVRSAVRSRARIVRGTPRAVLVAARLLRPLAGRSLLTADELRALGADLLTSAGPPLGERRFEDWLGEAAPTLGRRLASDARRPWS